MSKILILLLCCTLFFGGCGRPQQAVSSGPVCLAFPAQQTMAAAAEVLKELHFSLEKDDPQALYIRTRPLSGAQFFEFWRRDNADAYMTSQANLHSLRRIVEIEVYPRGQTVCTLCRVHVQRLSMPERPIESHRNMAAAFTESERTRQTIGVDDRQLEQMEWLDAGPDRALERRILNRLQRKLREGQMG